jgi:hypothetical protein
MNGPDEKARPVVPVDGEKLRIMGIDDLTPDGRTREALKRLAEIKAPRTVAQMVFWYVTDGADWDNVGRLSIGWGNASELALARKFVADLGRRDDSSSEAQADPGLLYWEIKADGQQQTELIEGLRKLWEKCPVLGLTAKEGIPARPDGPALSCQAEISDASIKVKLSASHPSGSDWIVVERFQIKRSLSDAVKSDPANQTPTLTPEQKKEREAALLGDALAAGMVERLVRVRLDRGPRVNGRESFRIKILNETPMVINGLALGGEEIRDDNPPAVLSGMSLPPLKNLTVPATPEVVSRLQLKKSLKVYAVDLSGI